MKRSIGILPEREMVGFAVALGIVWVVALLVGIVRDFPPCLFCLLCVPLFLAIGTPEALAPRDTGGRSRIGN